MKRYNTDCPDCYDFVSDLEYHKTYCEYRLVNRLKRSLRLMKLPEVLK